MVAFFYLITTKINKKSIYTIMKIIKEEYLNSRVTCPLTNKDVWVRFVPSNLYDIYSQRYPDIFVEEEIIEEDLFFNDDANENEIDPE